MFASLLLDCMIVPQVVATISVARAMLAAATATVDHQNVEVLDFGQLCPSTLVTWS